MFGRKSPEYDIIPMSQVPEFVNAPKPDDSKLPNIPGPKTWSVRYLDGAVEDFTSTWVISDSDWITFTDVTRYEWVYNHRDNSWCTQTKTQVVARVRVNHILKYQIVKRGA